MSFSGRVSRESHEGGLLVSFEGRAPRLGAGIRVVGGKTLGRVETVLGPSDEPLIHVHPLNGGVEAGSAIGSPVEIAPRGRVNQSRQDWRTGESKFRRGRDSRPGSRQGNDQRGRDRKFGGDRGSNMKPGDWSCPKCKNHNYANKKVCNRTGCEEPKPRGGGGRGRDSRGYQSNNSGGFNNSNMKPGDWSCPKCKNHNFANKKVCNRTGCEEPKPRGGGGRGRDSRGYRSNNSGGFNNSNMKPGDWSCPKCKNHNFSNKKVCNRTGCEEPKPRGGGGRGRDSRGYQSSNSGGFNDSNMKPGDWNCPKCKNHNYAKRTVCNRCDTRKPVEGKGFRKTQGRRRRPNPRDNWKGGGRPSSRHNGRGR
jgi:predicted nucleic-acid-binding Zn-ribbon protein/rRNA processing protein Gar1